MTEEEALSIVVKKYRKVLRISQEELAHLSELDRTYISLIERGKRKPTLNAIFKIARSLDMKASFLVKEIEDLLENDND